MSDLSPSGIAILLNEDGIIKKVIRDHIGIFNGKDPRGHSFTDYLEGDSISKGLELVKTVKKEGAVFNWEIHATVGKDDCLLTFSGIEIGLGIIILGTGSSNETEKLLNGLMEMNNEQINQLRSSLKESENVRRPQDDWELYNDMSSLNNELANTQRKLVKKTAELERINDLKDHMLGMAAHDLRNPLTLIQNFATFLMEDLRDQEELQEQYELSKEIKESSEYMVQIVEDMLDISTIESGKVNLDKEAVDLNNLIERSVELNRTSAQKKDIRLKVMPCEVSCVKEIDYHKFQQVLNNLISNAIKYSHSDTTVIVGLNSADQTAGDYVTMYVKDEGQGIPENELDELFKPFAKISVDATAGEKSTGLGLVITKKIVQAHGGTIEVESTVGEGSTFFVKLLT